jgi:hypothetical protein
MESSNTSNSEDKQSETDSHKRSPQESSTNAATNLCIICSTRQRAIAFVPCGHFVVCIPCGHGSKICPTCGSDIKGLLRIFG